jgi:hypothetical protein
VKVGAGFDQCPDRLALAREGGDVERRAAASIAGIDILSLGRFRIDATSPAWAAACRPV